MLQCFIEDFCRLIGVQPKRTNPLVVGLFALKDTRRSKLMPTTQPKLMLATQPETFYHPGSVSQTVRRFETATGAWTRHWDNAPFDQNDLRVCLFPGVLNTAAAAFETHTKLGSAFLTAFNAPRPSYRDINTSCKKRAMEISGGDLEFQRIYWRAVGHTIDIDPSSVIHIYAKTVAYPIAIMNATRTDALKNFIFIWITADDGHHILISKKSLRSATARKAFYKAGLRPSSYIHVRRLKYTSPIPMPGTVDSSGHMVTYSYVTLQMQATPVNDSDGPKLAPLITSSA